MPVDLLAENNSCGRAILQLVSKGNAIIAELTRLSEFVPSAYRLETRLDVAKYSDLIVDFSYFNGPDAFDAKITSNPNLQDLDDELRENHIYLLTEFYGAFESVHNYAVGLNRFVEELDEGYYIQQTLETVLNNPDGAQLLAESVYLYGVMLLVLDRRFEGVVRERLLIGFFRYSTAHSSSTHETSIEEVCKLMRSTGYNMGKPKPPNYPENFFQRVPINPTLVSMLIGKLRSEDLYHQILAFPLPEHRTTALATQSAMLFVCLYFDADLLKTQSSVMREIVDKHFPDNWVVAVYMGLIVNLIDAWEPYKAAKTALTNCLEAANIKRHAARKWEELQRLNTGLERFLAEEILSEEYLLDNSGKLMTTLRKCNATIRWLMLHTATLSSDYENVKRCKQALDQVTQEIKFDPTLLLLFLVNTSVFELKLKEKLKEMFAGKEKRWSELKSDSVQRLTELASVFNGVTPLTRVEKNDKLSQWFTYISTEVDSLKFDTVDESGRKIAQLIKALEDVQEYHNVETQVQLKQFLIDTRALLHHMLRVINMKDDTLVQMQIIGDLSYAWEVIDNYTKNMQDGIKRDPTMSIKLRATFLKLGSVLDLPLLRIQQANSNDLVSVSQYYSAELVQYVRRVLQIIPESVFVLLAKIIHLQTTKVKEVPTRLDKDKIKEFAQLDERFEIARLTHSISVLTEGILAMKTTLVGIIEVDPKRLFEDGIRKELVRQLALTMHNTLTFSSKAKQSELIPKLETLAKRIDGFRRSFEYISDYVNMCGLKIWQEEFSRLVNFNVEQECNVYSRLKIQDWESDYQSKTVPIPKFQPTDGQSLTFVGRVAREVLQVTDPKVTVFVEELTVWYDQKTKKDGVDPQLWKTLLGAMGTVGVSGLDRLYCFMLSDELHHFMLEFKRNVFGIADWTQLVESCKEELSSGRIIGQPQKFYGFLTSKCLKNMAVPIDKLMKIGQLQILRMQLVKELNSASKFESKLLENSLQNFNQALLHDVLNQRRKKIKVKDNSQLLFELSTYLEASGITDPMLKIYKMFPPTGDLSLFVLILVLTTLPKFVFVKTSGLTTRKATDGMDPSALLIGLATLLRQFVQAETDKFLRCLSQYGISTFHSLANPSQKPMEMPSEIVLTVAVLKEFIHHSRGRVQDLDDLMPKFIVDEYLASAT